MLWLPAVYGGCIWLPAVYGCQLYMIHVENESWGVIHDETTIKTLSTFIPSRIHTSIHTRQASFS
jgi:hypothetical protein